MNRKRVAFGVAFGLACALTISLTAGDKVERDGFISKALPRL
jgi:hypothetical protein